PGRIDARTTIPDLQQGVQASGGSSGAGRGEDSCGGPRARPRTPALHVAGLLRTRRPGRAPSPWPTAGRGGVAPPPRAAAVAEYASAGLRPRWQRRARSPPGGARAQGRPAGAGARFFQSSLAARQGATAAERRAWRHGVFALIHARTPPQGALSIERMCALTRLAPAVGRARAARGGGGAARRPAARGRGPRALGLRGPRGVAASRGRGGKPQARAALEGAQ